MKGRASETRGWLRWEQHRRVFEDYLSGLSFTDEP